MTWPCHTARFKPLSAWLCGMSVPTTQVSLHMVTALLPFIAHSPHAGVTFTHRCFSWHILTLEMASRSSGYMCSRCARASLASVLVESCFGHQMPAILDLEWAQS